MPQLKISFERAAEYPSKIYVFQAEPEATAQHTSSQEINIHQTDPIRSELEIEWDLVFGQHRNAHVTKSQAATHKR